MAQDDVCGATNALHVIDLVKLQTPRLILRQWNDNDFEPAAKMNADERVMEFFPATLSRSESDAQCDRIRSRLEERGWGLWVVERKDTGAFVGWTGLQPIPDYIEHLVGEIEVGWRLAHAQWGNGFAPEAARAAVQFAFARLGKNQILSMTSAINLRSRRVMEKLGMTYDPADDFKHPKFPGHRLEHHVLYRLRALDFARIMVT